MKDLVKNLKIELSSFFTLPMVAWFVIMAVWGILMYFSAENPLIFPVVFLFGPVVVLWAGLLGMYICERDRNKKRKAQGKILSLPFWERIFPIVCFFAIVIIWGIVIIASGFSREIVFSSGLIAFLATIIALIVDDKGWVLRFKFLRRHNI